MLKLESDEKILITLHHHWIAILGQFILVVILTVVPLVALPFLATSERAQILVPLYLFGLSLWYLLLSILAFSFWIDYYLDALIVTNKRIVNINQSGLFKNEMAVFRLERVQDVTIEVPNFIATVLRYGNVTIQTAGEISFSIKEVPHCHEVKDIILKYSRLQDAGLGENSDVRP
jgi:hypothetical protein